MENKTLKFVYFTLILNQLLFRIYKNITNMVKSKGPAFERIFEFCFDYKRYWYYRGRDTPIMNRLLFNKVIFMENNFRNLIS